MLRIPLKIVVSQFKKEIFKAETLLYQDIFILVGKKVIMVFTDRCLLKKRNYFLANPIFVAFSSRVLFFTKMHVSTNEYQRLRHVHASLAGLAR